MATTPAPSLDVEPESDQATASFSEDSGSVQVTVGLHVEPNATTTPSVGDSWYDSSSEQEWPMSLPTELSDWSNSFTQSNSHSPDSDSSWETEEVEEVVGGDPANLAPNDLPGELEEENWESELVETVTSTVMTTIVTSVMVNTDAYDSHIRLDQNGTDENETSNDEST